MRTGFPAFQAVPPREQQATQAVEPASPPNGAAQPPEAGFSGLFMILMFVPLLLFLFWQSRSQQKKQEAAISELKKGDRVVTQSGLVGRLVEIDNRYAKLELAPGVKVQVLRSSLAGRDAEESAKTTETQSVPPKAGDARSTETRPADAKSEK